MANNYSTLGFWRSWHRSYNLWLIRYVVFSCAGLSILTTGVNRYIYIPLGGTKHAAISTLVIFTFVALWHDLSFKLLAWGWLVTLFILPELAAVYFLPAVKVRIPIIDVSTNQSDLYIWQYGRYAWFRHICAVGAVLNILMMLSANLVGFVIGADGMMYMIKQIGGAWAGMFISSLTCWLGLMCRFSRLEIPRNGLYMLIRRSATNV